MEYQTMRPPTPETISIITAESGSARICRSTSKSPAASHVYAVEMRERSSRLSAHVAKNATSAPPNATNVVSVEIQPAVRREIVWPATVIARQLASGASRQIQAPTAGTAPSASQGARPVDVERHAATRHRHDQPEPDRDLAGSDGHDREREHLAVQRPLLSRERDKRQVAGVQHDLEREQHDERASPEHHSHRPSGEEDSRDDQVPAGIRP